MRIKVTQTVEVPATPYCDKCYRREYSEKQKAYFCSLFNCFLYFHGGRLTKCKGCYDALYKHIEGIGNE